MNDYIQVQCTQAVSICQNSITFEDQGNGVEEVDSSVMILLREVRGCIVIYWYAMP